MIRKGFEPLTHRLEICCSIQLSYRTKLKTPSTGEGCCWGGSPESFRENLRPSRPEVGTRYRATLHPKNNFKKCCPHGELKVGVAGFEPTTSCSQSRRDTGLRYTPKNFNDLHFNILYIPHISYYTISYPHPSNLRPSRPEVGTRYRAKFIPIFIGTTPLKYGAERGGFEPPVQFPVRQFSKLLVSATHPPLQ